MDFAELAYWIRAVNQYLQGERARDRGAAPESRPDSRTQTKL